MAFEGSDLADKRTLSGLVRTMSGRLDRLMEESSRGGAGAASTEEARNNSVTEDVSLSESLPSRGEFPNFFSSVVVVFWGRGRRRDCRRPYYTHTPHQRLAGALCGDGISIKLFIWH